MRVEGVFDAVELNTEPSASCNVSRPVQTHTMVVRQVRSSTKGDPLRLILRVRWMASISGSGVSRGGRAQG